MSLESTDNVMPIGHNNPPSAVLPDKDAYLTQVRKDMAEFETRLDELTVEAANLPLEITADNAGRVTNFITQARGAIKKANGARLQRHREIKALEKDLKAMVDGWSDALNKVLEPIADRMGVYQRAVAEIERKRREDEQRRLDEHRRAAEAAAEAKRLEAERIAQAAETEADMQAASEAQKVAEDAATAAEIASKVKVEERDTSVRGAYGASVAFDRKHWAFEITDATALPPSFLMPDEKAIREYLRGVTKDGGQPEEVPGVKWIEEHKTVFKGT